MKRLRIVKKHVKNYLDARKLTVADVILCEVCSSVAVDIHHIKYKGQGGSDEHENLIALCRCCHDKAHAGKISKTELQRRKICY